VTSVVEHRCNTPKALVPDPFSRSLINIKHTNHSLAAETRDKSYEFLLLFLRSQLSEREALKPRSSFNNQ
jgi:hypothetical protein